MPGTRKQSLQPEDVKKVITLARGVGRGRKLLSCGNKFLSVLKLQERQLNLSLPLKLEKVKKLALIEWKINNKKIRYIGLLLGY